MPSPKMRATPPRPPKPGARGVRYAAFLRGVMPTNAKMSELAGSFVDAGFDAVATVLGSGNVVFTAPRAPEAELERAAEAAMRKRLGRVFDTYVRTVEELDALLASDPYAGFALAPDAKRVVSFLREAPRPRPKLPVEQDGARILRLDGRVVLSAYVRTPQARGPVFMVLLERTFGRDITTRTWETLQKVATVSARQR